MANALPALALCACGSDDAAEDADGNGGDPFGNADGESGSRGEGDAGEGGGGDEPARDAGADDAGTGGRDAGGEGGEGEAGTGGEGGEGGGDAGGTPGGPIGTLPLGALCANDANCSQDMGDAVCCINSCELVQDCAGSPGYLPCTSRADCEPYGGSKVCCDLGSQRFCTKQSACSGEMLP